MSVFSQRKQLRCSPHTLRVQNEPSEKSACVMQSTLPSIVPCESLFPDHRSKYLFTALYCVTRNETLEGLLNVLLWNYTYLQNILIILRQRRNSTLPARWQMLIVNHQGPRQRVSSWHRGHSKLNYAVRQKLAICAVKWFQLKLQIVTRKYIHWPIRWQLSSDLSNRNHMHNENNSSLDYPNYNLKGKSHSRRGFYL